MSDVIRSKDPTDAYREGWDRVFAKHGPTLCLTPVGDKPSKPCILFAGHEGPCHAEGSRA